MKNYQHQRKSPPKPATSQSGRQHTFNRNNSKPSLKRLDTNLFVKKADPVEENRYFAPRQIGELSVDHAIISNLLKKGYRS
ncbi:MAG: hypothetical protein V2A54_07205, partial [Bacteroidota bacterium]